MNGKELPSGSFLKYTAHQFKKMLDADELLKYRVDAPNKQYEFWQRDPLAVELYSPDIVYQKLDYIHNNPLSGKWNLAEDPIKYEYSSAAFYELGSKRFNYLKH
ncbi:MAG: transposase, partial [Bacteroidota bacterium]